MGKPFQRAGVVRDPDFRREWLAAQPWCVACGIDRAAALLERFPSALQAHHVIKPGRSDEAAVLLALCEKCHRLAEGHRIRERGALLPKIELAHCLWLKKMRNPLEWNPERLEALLHQAIPCIEPPPDVYMAEFAERRRAG